MLGSILSAKSLFPSLLAEGAGPVLSPSLILFLSVLAGIATVLLLPSRQPRITRQVGAAFLILAGIIFAAALIQATGTATRDYIFFWIFAVVAIAGAMRVVTHRTPVYSALYFILTVFASAGLFVLLSAGFMAAALVLIYAGAILITYVFVIMLAAQASAEAVGTATTILRTSEYDAVSREPIVAATVGFALMGVLLFVIFDKAQGLAGPSDRKGQVAAAPIQGRDLDINKVSGGTQKLGVYLFKNQLVNLELAGLILTVAMVGAILIARRRVITPDVVAGRAPEMVTATATPINDDPHSIPVFGTRNPRQKAYPET